jgi:hypothetical protein
MEKIDRKAIDSKVHEIFKLCLEHTIAENILSKPNYTGRQVRNRCKYIAGKQNMQRAGSKKALVVMQTGRLARRHFAHTKKGLIMSHSAKQ